MRTEGPRSSGRGPSFFLGVDLAWGARNHSGLAAVDSDGTLLDLTDLRTDEDILAWLRPYTQGPCLVAVDAPIVVTNPAGRRRCEAELGRVFARYDAGPHPSNTRRPEFAHGSRALRITEALDLDIDPTSHAARRAVEVYPHPATVVLFDLERTVKYKHKPGRDLDLLRRELLRLMGLVESLERADPPLLVGQHPGWRKVRAAVEGSTRKVHLRSVEDVVDAVVCAYIGLFAERRPERTRIFGDAHEGCILTPVRLDQSAPLA